MSVRRFDRSDFQKAEITPQGFLRAPAYATRIGILHYKKADGTILKEFRPPQEVFNVDSMKTLANVPLTNQHPRVKGDLLNPSNAAANTVGFTGDVVEQAEQKFLKVITTVIDAHMIAKAKDYELSCGYTCDLVNEPGIFEGEPYDVVQRNIVYNHLAMVPKGRAGDEVRIHLDADDGILMESKENPKMAKMKIGDKEFDAAPELAAAHEAMMKKHEDEMCDMKKKMDDLEQKMGKSGEPDKKEPVENQPAGKEEDKKDSQYSGGKVADGKDGDKMAPKQAEAAAKMDAMQARLDALTAQLNKSAPASADFGKAVSARVALIGTASEIVDTKKVKLDSLSDIEIMKEVVKADSGADMSGKSDDYVRAYFDIVKERRLDAGKARSEIGASIAASRRVDGVTTEPNANQARLDAAKRQAEMNKKPVGVNMSTIK